MLRRSGRIRRTETAPKGWNAPDPIPEAAAIPTRIGNVGAKPIAANEAAVHTSASPVKRVPYRSARNPNRGCESEAVPP